MPVLKTPVIKLSDIFIGPVTPHGIASGFAIGTAIALLPTFGFGILLVVPLLILFPDINKPATFIAFAFWNPLIQIPIYALSFKIGSLLFGDLPIVKYNIEILNQIHTLTRRLIAGNIIVTTIFSTCSYIIVYAVSRSYLIRRGASS